MGSKMEETLSTSMGFEVVPRVLGTEEVPLRGTEDVGGRFNERTASTSDTEGMFFNLFFSLSLSESEDTLNRISAVKLPTEQNLIPWEALFTWKTLTTHGKETINETY